MKRITIELPIVKVATEDPWCGCDYGKEHYEHGMFVIDDGISRYFGMWDGLSLWHCPIPHDIIDKYIVERAISNNDEIYHRDMERIEERLEQISRLFRTVNDNITCSETRLMNELDAMSERLSDLPKTSSDGANVLDIARAFAVISKPELIKELSK